MNAPDASPGTGASFPVRISWGTIANAAFTAPTLSMFCVLKDHFGYGFLSFLFFQTKDISLVFDRIDSII